MSDSQDGPQLLAELRQANASLQAEVAERLRVEVALRQSEARFRALLEHAPEALLLVDAHGRIALANQQAERLFGWALDDLVGRTIEELMPERFRGGHAGHRQRFADKPVSRPMGSGLELCGLRKDGSEFPLEISLSPVRDGGQAAVLASIRDITARNQAEARERELVRLEVARVEAERLHRQTQFLAEASATLAGSLDFHVTLATVAHQVVPRLADWCIVDVVAQDGQLQRVAATHVDPDKASLALEFARRFPDDPDASLGPHVVIRTGKPALYPVIPDQALVDYAKGPEHLAALRDLGLRSALVLPMVGPQGGVVGALTLCAAESDRRYDEQDLTLTLELARRCGTAIENARLYLQAQEEIDRRQVAQRALEAESERLTVTLRSIGDGVITTDVHGRVTMLNPIAEELTGWPNHEAAGRPIEDVFPIVHEKTRSALENPVQVVLRTGDIVMLANHTALLARDGTERIIADSGAPIRTHDGETVGAVLVFRDVTEKERLDAELQRTSKLESLGVLAGGIAHDFNNILTGVLGNLSMATLMAHRPAELLGILADAEKAALRARDLTQQLLTFAKGGAPVKKPTSLRGLIQDSACFALSGSNCQPVFELAEDLSNVEVDAGQISQVVQNLVLNAQQAMPHGGLVRVQAENLTVHQVGGVLAPGRYVRISIHDHGPGIAPEHLQRIFEPFFTTKRKGSGLGLATAHAIVRKHDGHLSVDSRPGVGSVFRASLPVTETATELVAVPKPSVRAVGAGRLLVMDDEEMLRGVISAMLRRAGYELETVADGVPAIRAYRKAMERGERFDAVILDLTVPGGMGGLATLEQLRVLDPEVRAIVSSGYSDDPVMAHYRQHGFAGVVAKPYTMHDLQVVVAQVLARG